LLTRAQVDVVPNRPRQRKSPTAEDAGERSKGLTKTIF
jgi:hypothetical protein